MSLELSEYRAVLHYIRRERDSIDDDILNRIRLRIGASDAGQYGFTRRFENVRGTTEVEFLSDGRAHQALVLLDLFRRREIRSLAIEVEKGWRCHYDCNGRVLVSLCGTDFSSTAECERSLRRRCRRKPR